MRVMTIGHSTRSLDDLVALLEAHGVTGIADVRRIPGSRRHPHFSRDALTESLPSRGITYDHLAGLGGRRKPSPDSPNAGWQHPSFRAYADYMATGEFGAALDELLALAESRLVAVMCAEAQWWRCHRRLIADALLARSVEVRHIMAANRAPAHELTPFARRDGVDVTYPGLF